MKFGKIKAAATDFLNKYKNESPASYAAAEQAVGGLLILDGFVGIDNPLGGKKRSGIFGTLISIVIGVVFLFMPFFTNVITGVDKLTATTSATVVSVGPPSTTTSSNGQTTSSGGACSLVVSYTVDGKVYSQGSSFSSSGNCSLTPGSTTQINYNPQNPGTWARDISTLKLIMFVFPLAGGLLIITGIITFLIRLFSIIFGWKLLMSGRRTAKTLPPGTEISTMISEIRQDFANHVFNFNSAGPLVMQQSTVATPAPVSMPSSQLIMPSPQPVVEPIPGPAPVAQPAPVEAPAVAPEPTPVPVSNPVEAPLVVPAPPSEQPPVIPPSNTNQ
jgi:hypothetical protein